MIVATTKRFDRQAEAAARWRRERHGPSTAISDAIEWISDHLATNPRMGEAVENPRTVGLRRFPLLEIDYIVYWTVDDARGEVKLTAIRHAKRRPIRM